MTPAASGLLLALAVARDDVRVWAVDDGEKIKQDAPAPPALATGAENPIWSPGQPIRLFAARNETVAFQVVVSAGAAPLDGVTVDLDALTSGASRIANAVGDAGAGRDPTGYVGRSIERFVEHFLTVGRPSGGRTPGESLGWAPGSGPPADRWTGKIPDALIPVEVAPSWAPYPLAIAPRENGIVWIDVTVGRSQPPGLHRGEVVVRSAGAALATLPVELEVADVTLPERPVRTMLHSSRQDLERRFGPRGAADAAEKHLFRLLHRHRLAPMHDATSLADVRRREAALDGSLYAASAGYEGPAEGMGDGVLALGAYGALGAPDAAKLATVEAIADLLEEKGLLSTTDTFVYANDEDCNSPWGKEWKRLLAGSPNPRVKKVRVAWTCSEDPAGQVVDVPILAATFDRAKAERARAVGKEIWVYNGSMPQTGSFLTDTPATSPRVNGWLQAMFDVGRWFYWETTFWNDDNRGGHGPHDPFVTAETFHNADGDHAMGDGVLVYPGTQVGAFAARSLGMGGVIASIRLKNWRRGIQDAGIFQLARAADPARAEAIAKALLPAAFAEAKSGRPPSWSAAGKPYFEARKALLALVPRGTNGGPGLGAASRAPAPAGASPLPPGAGAGAGVGAGTAATSSSSGSDGGSCGGACGRGCHAGSVGLLLAPASALLLRRRRRPRR